MNNLTGKWDYPKWAAPGLTVLVTQLDGWTYATQHFMNGYPWGGKKIRTEENLIKMLENNACAKW